MPKMKSKPAAAPLAVGSKRARTRENLLDAAAELFQARGVAAVSLDEVAAHAGLTKGAIYGNFASKDDLVFAVTAERTSKAIPIFDGEAPLKDQLRELVKRHFSVPQKKARAHFAFLAELDLYALTREPLARRFIEFARECHEKSAANVARVSRKGSLPLQPLELSVVLTGMLNGLLFQHACYPDVVTEEVVLAALGALVD
jgi:AcrR family transcriptional regulator